MDYNEWLFENYDLLCGRCFVWYLEIYGFYWEDINVSILKSELFMWKTSPIQPTVRPQGDNNPPPPPRLSHALAYTVGLCVMLSSWEVLPLIQSTYSTYTIHLLIIQQTLYIIHHIDTTYSKIIYYIYNTTYTMETVYIFYYMSIFLKKTLYHKNKKFDKKDDEIQVQH